MSQFSKDFPLVNRVISRISKSLDFPYTCQRGLTKGLKRRGGLGFLPGGIATAEHRFLWSLDLKGKTVFDIGGFQGLMTIFFASRAARVITYEPLPSSRRKILDNVKLNGFTNVQLRDVALSSEPGELRIVYDDLMSGGASGDPIIADELAKGATSPKVEVVPMTTVDAEIASGQPIPDMIKVDVEGMEYNVLRGMSKLIATRKPWLFFELHGTTPENKQRNAGDVIGGLRNAGYEVYDVESDRVISRGEPITGRESHIFAR